MPAPQAIRMRHSDVESGLMSKAHRVRCSLRSEPLERTMNSSEPMGPDAPWDIHNGAARRSRYTMDGNETPDRPPTISPAEGRVSLQALNRHD